MSGPPRKRPKLTETTKSHRYETFTKRIAKIKIDPVHKVQLSRITDERNDLTKSFFRTALDEWAELNLTTTFTSFYNEASPLSESLPQLLHHADRIMDSLLMHIKKQHELALEPLLSLVAQLAHDLGQEFAKYLERTVDLVAQVAASVQDPAAIESCFTCLAWIYKYMSRRLVQDLRPLFDILIPHMSVKKEYVRRFTAESLAYLVRKAAMLYSKNAEPLRLALQHLFGRLSINASIVDSVAFQDALMTLLVESMMGVEAKTHTSAVDLMSCALQIVAQTPQGSAHGKGIAVVEGTTIGLVHQTDADGFEPMLSLIVSQSRDCKTKDTEFSELQLRLLLAAAATRKGSRVKNWIHIAEAVVSATAIHSKDDEAKSHSLILLQLSAAVVQYTPLEQLLPHIGSLIDAVMSQFSAAEFLTFCQITAKLGPQRFRDFLLVPLQKFIVESWERDEAALCYVLTELHEQGLVHGRPGSVGYLCSPKQWDKHIVSSLEPIGDVENLVPFASRYLQLMDAIQVPKETSDIKRLQTIMHLISQAALRQGRSKFDGSLRIGIGWALVKDVTTQGNQATGLWDAITQAQRDAFYMRPFLQACQLVLNSRGQESSTLPTSPHLVNILVENMLTDSIELRRQSIELLSTIGRTNADSWLFETSELLLEIVRTPYLVSNARQLSMLVRKLPQRQKELSQDTLYLRLVPHFSMSMLRHYYDQVRKDVCASLKLMAGNPLSAEIIIETAIRWLETPGHSESGSKTPSPRDNADYLSSFECSNLKAIGNITSNAFTNISNAAKNMQERFELVHQLYPPQVPAESRAIALQVLLEMPEIVERRSRSLIPVFLAALDRKRETESPPSDNSISSHTISIDADERTWELRDRKMFLELISKFVNPRVLFRADETREALMECLANGNAELRKFALTAILKWKDVTLRKYEDILLRVAEEQTATAELAALLNNSDGDGSIESHDRKAVLPVLLRLLFGQLIGRSRSHGSQEAKRKAILRLLFRLDELEIIDFLKIALGRLGHVTLSEEAKFPEHTLQVDIVSTDQQYGFLRMILSMMEVLQSQFTPYSNVVVAAVVYCTVRASKQIISDEDGPVPAGALIKNIRRTGLQCLTILFEESPTVDWSPYLAPIFDNAVRPRLATLASDMTQGISVLLRMISSWCLRSQLLFVLRDYESALLPALWDLVASETVRQEVKIFVIESVVGRLAEHSQATSEASDVATKILEPQMNRVMEVLTSVLEHQPSKDLLVSVTNIIPQLATHAAATTTSNQTLSVLINLLCQPHQKMPPHVKAGLLQATESLLAHDVQTIDFDLKDKLFEVVAGFYNYFRDSPNRATTSRILELLSKDDNDLLQIIRLCTDLNATSSDRLNEIDYEKRLTSYNSISGTDISQLPRSQLLPLVHNLLFFARTADDFSIRSNAVSCLRKVVVSISGSRHPDIGTLLVEILLPAFKKGFREDSETVRADFVALFGTLIKHGKEVEQLRDLQVLLVGDDEEASFFTNILHIQQHRRTRAIRRLVTEVEKGKISSNNIAEYLLPLLEQFANDTSGDDSVSGTKGHSIAAIADILKWVDWKVFRRIFRQYRHDLDSTAKPEKDTIKLLSNAADALTTAVELREGENRPSETRPYLAATLPVPSSIESDLKEHFIPKLGKFIHHKDEAEISLRIPAARVAVKLIKLLPSDDIPGLVTPIILDIAQILRSRTQESRDVARNTLAEIVLLLGPSSMQFVLKELRTTLDRGYQLHVLSFTMHTILLVSVNEQQPGDLDYCVDAMVAVIMDDIFGVVGQEKENQDYISTMKEVKSSKSFDSMELLARSSGVRALSQLLKPFQSLLLGSLSAKQLRQIDDLLRRIGVGISHNPVASSRDLLVFAYELIQDFYMTKSTSTAAPLTTDEKNRQRYLIQLESAHKSTSSSSASHLYKLAKFSLDIVRSVMLKQPTLMTAQNIHGFLPIIGDAIIQGQEDIRISAFRLLSAVIKLPLRELDENAALYVMEAVKVVRSSINTNEEAAQAALKLVTVLLRDRKHIEIRDTDIAYLLQRTMPDLEEPDRQGVTFNFLKAVMARQMQLLEVYEIMDKVAVMMVTNQTKHARDAARGVLVHFLLDYPQSEKRWIKQMKFLLKNLDYEHPEGRQSVMEAIYSLLQKLDDDKIQDFVSTFFVPVVLRMANDDHLGCREMAGALLSQLFRKSSQAQLQTLLEPLRSWAAQTDNDTLTKLSLQAWNLFFEVNPTGASDEIPAIRNCIRHHLHQNQDEDFWTTQFQALELLSKIAITYPKLAMTNKQHDIWVLVCSLLCSHHTWVQSSAAGLIDIYLESTVDSPAESTSLVGQYGLKLDQERVTAILRSSIRVLKNPKSGQELARKTLKNLLFLSSWAESNSLKVEVKMPNTKDTVVNEQGISDHESSDEDGSLTTISAVQYVFDQLTSILRREPSLFTAQAFLPRLSALHLLIVLIQKLSVTSIPQQSITALLMPLTYITDADTNQPRSADQMFPETYNSYTESAQLLLEALQSNLGDSTYVKLLTDATRTMRKRREERRQKRAVERIVEPEKAARDKRRKVEGGKERRKEVRDIHRKGRRRDLGF